MSNTTKTYRIEIEMSAAQQALADTTKKLAALDKQLEGLDSGSDAAKKITADMAKLVGEIERLEQSTEGFAAKLDGLKPGTVSALEAEIEELEAAFRRATIGTEEYEQAFLKLGSAKGQLKTIEDGLDALAPKERAAAFVDMASGLAGAVGVVAIAGQTFGLSADKAAEYEAKMQTVVAITSSFEAISKALNSESRANLSSLLNTAKAYLTGGEAATTGGKAARLAIAGTGIGLLIIALAYVVTNWEKLTKTVVGSEAGFAKVKATASGLFDGLVASVKVGAEAITKFVTGDFSGAANAMRGAGKKIGDAYRAGFESSLFEGYKVILQKQIDYNEQLLKIQEASGRNTFALQRKILLDRIVVAKESNEQEKKDKLALIGDLATLDRTEQVRQKKAAVDAAQARLEAVIAVEQAKGNEIYKYQLQSEGRRLAALKAAAQPNEAEIIAQQGRIAALTATHEQEQTAKHRAALVERQQAEIALLEAQGQYTLDLKIQNARELLALDTGTNDKALAQKRADTDALNLLLVEQANFEQDIQQKNFEQQQDEQGRMAERTAGFYSDTTAWSEAFVQRMNELAKRPFNLGATILEKLFGVKPEDVEKVKGQINEAAAAIAQTAQQISNAVVGAALSAVDAQLEATRNQLSLLDQQLQASQSAAEKSEEEAGKSSGARRDYYLAQLGKQRAETDRLAAAKRKAAEEEKKQLKEQQQLQKEGQRVALALTAATAIQAAVQAIAQAAAIPFPANIPAIIVAGATVASGVFAAKALGDTFADGGVVDGPRHAQGGVQLWHQSGAHLGEMEGGEHITNRQATANNLGWLDFINTAGRARPLTAIDFSQFTLPYEIAPPPAGYYPGHYANGGTLPTGGELAGSGPGASDLSARMGALEAQAARTNQLLEQVVQHVSDTSDSNKQIAGYGPAVLEFGYDAELKRQKLVKGVEDAKASAGWG
ncbi:hypothetical protein Q5H92_26350 [Hymenobacter sp. M29]|uniref:Bacteriophage tail tape measure N-terminal domain-containing protein n=1 Tax=Hymenobacter mellowenesis TaxID=3063995 RepID=A0ABT9AJ61_9BACT|nr:hypothetical protein [Hymenobacter sp. M29]MDO7849908.1 hypothetical protein [Hymenobacter sp. M29]